MKNIARLAFVAIISALALQLGSGYSIGGIAQEGPQSNVGDPCTAGAGCNEGTECNPYVGEGFCTCAEGFHADETFCCVSGAEVVGSRCKNGVGCEHLPHSECSSANNKGTCKCLAGFHGDVGSTCMEVPASKVGDPCTAGAGCKGNAECNSKDGAGFCTCTDGYHADVTFSCVRGPEVVGSTCKNGVGCEHLPHSECSSANDKGTCKCSAGFHGEDGSTCMEDRPSKIGDACTDGSGCNGNIKCSSEKGPGFCTCNTGFRPDDNLSCVSGAEVLGGPCRNGVGCEQIQNSDCSSISTEVGECKCLAGFHGEDGGTTCTQDSDSKVGDLCRDGSGCNGNMECTSTTGSGFCTCIDGYHADETLSCVAGPETVGSMCKNGVGCEFLANSECSIIYFTGICQCSEGYHAENGGATCTKDPEESKLGDICTDANGCYGNTECNSKDGPGFCTCKTGYHADGTLNCVAGGAIIGSACTHNLGCEKVPGLKCNVTDDQGKCTCNDGFHVDGEGKNCMQDVGSPCNPSVGCFDPAAECKMNQMGDYTCQCREGFEAVVNICKMMDSGLHIRVHVEEAKDIDIEIDKF